jgi:hypothetical protein
MELTAHATFHNDDLLALICIDDRHACNGTTKLVSNGFLPMAGMILTCPAAVRLG